MAKHLIDRSIYEDNYVFARALYQLDNMAERDYFAYRRLFELVWRIIAQSRFLGKSGAAFLVPALCDLWGESEARNERQTVCFGIRAHSECIDRQWLRADHRPANTSPLYPYACTADAHTHTAHTNTYAPDAHTHTTHTNASPTNSHIHTSSANSHTNTSGD